jgi:hypothetical protein
MALSQLVDLATTAKGRILAQYRQLTLRFVPEIEALVAQVQEIENNFWTFFTYLDLDTAPGTWLDRLAGQVGEQRGGFGDAALLRFTKARIIANKSNGSDDTILLVTSTALGAGPTYELVDWFPAGFALTVSGIALGGLTGDVETLKRLINLLRITRAVSVGLGLFYQDDNDNSVIFVMGDSGGGPVVGLGFDDSSAPNDPLAGRLAGVAQA